MDGVPEEVYSQLPAGRYEFKDSGIYIGEWLNEKAVGIGLLTKDKSQGEFTGLWNSGSEKCGVFLWPSAPGAMYEGEWANSKRDGYGIFIKEDWIVMGKFQEGFITLGVKTKEKSIGKFEGEFEDGCPVFGMETYADGGTYCGDYKSGLREGLGVRTSIPYGEIFAFLPEEKHLLLKGTTDDNSTNVSFTSNHVDKNGSTSKLPNKFKCGFVLSGKKSDLLIKKLRHINSCKKHQKGLKRSKSLTSIFSALTKKELYNTKNIHKNHFGTISVYSVPGNASPKSFHSSLTFNTIQSIATMDLSAGDTIAPDVFETYSGEWVQDQRHGFGVCERSDGVIYEGGWLNNKRHGFGITKFSDGSFEEGQYQNGKLIFLWTKRNPIFFLYSFRMGLHIKKSVKQARNASKKAQEKDMDCRKKLTEIRETVKKAKEAAALAREYSLETRQLVKEMYPDYEQPGIRILSDIVRMMRVTKRGQKSFESMLQAAIDVVEGRGVPDMISTSDNLTVNYNKDNFLLVDADGEHRASRHGSFRRSKKLSTQNASKDTHLKQGNKPTTEFNHSSIPNKRIESQNCPEDPKLPNKLQQLEPIQPVTFHPIQQSSKFDTIKLQEAPILRVLASPIDFPKAQIVIEKISNTTPLECQTPVNEIEEIEEEVYVPVGNIMATSRIPHETLSSIISSNTHIDYFNHYSQSNADQSEKILKSKIYSINSSSPNSNINNPRRFTVPEIMTQEPVHPTPVTNILRDLQEEVEDEINEFPDTMILMDGGIRKRVSPVTMNNIKSRTESKITLNQPQDGLRPLPMIFNFTSEVNLSKDLQEGSLPDVSATKRRCGIPREEVIRLGEEYQHAIELDKQKLKQGVFVIRFYKLGDWLRDHAISLVVIFINLCLLYFFIAIIKDYKIS